MIDWDEIHAEHGPVVWRTAYKLLGRYADALDCYQETFLAAYRAAERRPVAHWPSFLTTLATRRAIDRLRRRGRARKLFTPLDEATEPPWPGASPEEHSQDAEQLDEVRGLLAGIPAKQAEVFWLSCVEDLSHAEIAGQLRISAGEVRVLLHRARVRLRAALESRLPDPRRDR